MKSKLLLLTLLSVLPVALCAQEAESRRRFEEELAVKSGEIGTIACRFEQVRKSVVLKEEVRKTGVFHYKRPERMRLLFAEGDCITMNGTDFQLLTSGRRTLVKMQSNPMLRELQRILAACMTGDMEQLAAGFVATLHETDEDYELTLAPRRKNRLKDIVLRFSKKDMSLDALRMDEASGDWMLYRFSDKRFGEPVADELFEIER